MTVTVYFTEQRDPPARFENCIAVCGQAGELRILKSEADNLNLPVVAIYAPRVWRSVIVEET